MKTKTPDEAGPGTDDATLSTTDVFGVLANDRCRYLLHYLDHRVGGVSLGELAERVAVLEDDPTYDHYERVLTGLHHVQLPKLTETGLVVYDREAETVTGTGAIAQVRPYLELAMAGDIREA
ncbi:DUF7344 domain-containing protein [Halorarum salinum]|uniref:DUF7344 domain-containing protein n=1 Tax=Halorarum salinum TaxID=2743089 RepID=A0A7D5L9J6_9EURY|nr:hypothetical protein [Halobaculum salinum]QLG61274.1 hypothetical protein HUG12_05810 [Halobaculum salinum]